MEWMVILQQVFELCIIPLLGIITFYIVQFIRAKTGELNSNNSNEILSKYVEMLSNTICECVIATNQTYVDSLKKQGKFDIDAQKKAFEMTYNAVISILSDEAKIYLSNIYGDLNKYITNMIEAEVNKNKE
ncbi:hypothetical protein [Clostridium sp.]|uniref:hypothetical protein n=1 Tax=Clostridium sp. TaxID=1506 RepID=UPI0025C03A4E|nr:hypothetical protein [Clostridium sp.]